jgi:hypothetical protein
VDHQVANDVDIDGSTGKGTEAVGLDESRATD